MIFPDKEMIVSYSIPPISRFGLRVERCDALCLRLVDEASLVSEMKAIREEVGREGTREEKGEEKRKGGEEERRREKKKRKEEKSRAEKRKREEMRE